MGQRQVVEIASCRVNEVITPDAEQGHQILALAAERAGRPGEPEV